MYMIVIYLSDCVIRNNHSFISITTILKLEISNLNDSTKNTVIVRFILAKNTYYLKPLTLFHDLPLTKKIESKY